MRHLITVVMAAVACLGIAVPAAVAQTAKDLVGTWTLESDTSTTPDGRTIQPFGPNPSGIAIFDNGGRFAIVISRPDLPKFASNDRMQGTAKENEAIVRGSFAFFGTYSITEGIIDPAHRRRNVAELDRNRSEANYHLIYGERADLDDSSIIRRKKRASLEAREITTPRTFPKPDSVKPVAGLRRSKSGGAFTRE